MNYSTSFHLNTLAIKTLYIDMERALRCIVKCQSQGEKCIICVYLKLNCICLYMHKISLRIQSKLVVWLSIGRGNWLKISSRGVTSLYRHSLLFLNL